MWCEKATNCQLQYTQHGELTCKSTKRNRRPARLQPACSARCPARRCVVCTRCALSPPREVSGGMLLGTVQVGRKPKEPSVTAFRTPNIRASCVGSCGASAGGDGCRVALVHVQLYMATRWHYWRPSGTIPIHFSLF